MKKIFFVFSLMLILNLSAEAYTYQWNVPYDNYGVVYPGNVKGGMYYGGNYAIVKNKPEVYDQYPRTTYNKRCAHNRTVRRGQKHHKHRQ